MITNSDGGYARKGPLVHTDPLFKRLKILPIVRFINLECANLSMIVSKALVLYSLNLYTPYIVTCIIMELEAIY